MNPREKILGMGKLYLMRGEPIPLDLLAEAERLGLSLIMFEQPLLKNPEKEGEYFYVSEDE